VNWADLATVQDGLVATRQLGLTEDALRWAVTDGRLVRVRRGVYRVPGAPTTTWQALRAALLAADDAVASHRAAAGLHHFPGVLPGAAEITVFCRTSPRLPGVTAHRATLLVAEDITEVDGFPVTTPARTVVDLAAVVHPALLERMLDRCDPHEVAACLERIGTASRRGTRPLRVMLAARVGGESPLEQRWLRRLKRAGLPPPVVGYQLVVGNRVLILDMAWPEHRVALEVDGWSAHSTRTQFDRDRERDLVATRAGWRVLRVTSRTPLNDLMATLTPLVSQKPA
jgi:very-short-patch-repair endonuclease